MVKSWIAHFLIGSVFGLLGWWGVLTAFSFFLGVELTQAAYRSFSEGYRWKDVYSKPWAVLKYLPAKDGGWIDTVLDLLLPLIGASLVAYLKGGLL